MLEEAFSATTAERVSSDTVKAIISGNTIDLEVPNKGTARACMGADGTVLRKMGAGTAKGIWRLAKDDTLCVKYTDKNERCGPVTNNGDGTCTRLDDAGTTFIRKEITEGDVL
jgi:hypothetical protein